jgi:putative MATE family efflux protein
MTPPAAAPSPAAADPAVWPRLARLAGPALAQQCLLLVIQHTDQWLATPFGAAEKAALTTANYVYWIISCYAVVVGAGATALVGRSVGGGDRRTADRAAGQSLLLAAAFGLAGTLAALPGLPLLADAVALAPDSSAAAAAYLRPLVGVLTLQLVETAGIACLVGAGDTRTGLLVLAGVTAVNGPVGYMASRGVGLPPLGFEGIAWGTAASHAAGGLAVFAVLLRGRSGLRVRPADLVPDLATIRRLLRVSVPAALDSLSVAVCQLWFLRIVNGLGDAAGSAHGIALRWEALGYLTGAAFGTAASALVSQNLGAGHPDRAARAGWTTAAAGAAAMSFMGAVFFTLARPMCRLYSPDDPAVVDLAVRALRTVAFAMPALASTQILTQALRSAGDARIGVLISWFGFLAVRIPLAYLLTGPAAMGLFGAWLAMFADLWVRGLLFAARFAGGRWRAARV